MNPALCHRLAPHFQLTYPITDDSRVRTLAPCRPTGQICSSLFEQTGGRGSRGACGPNNPNLLIRLGSFMTSHPLSCSERVLLVSLVISVVVPDPTPAAASLAMPIDGRGFTAGLSAHRGHSPRTVR